MANLYYIPFINSNSSNDIHSDLFRVTLKNDVEYQLYTKILSKVLKVSHSLEKGKFLGDNKTYATTDLCMVYKSKAAFNRKEDPLYSRPVLVLDENNKSGSYDFIGFLKKVNQYFPLKGNDLNGELFELTKFIYQFLLSSYGSTEKQKMVIEDYKTVLINQFCFLKQDFLNSYLNPLENPFFVTGESLVFDFKEGNMYKILGLITEDNGKDRYIYYHSGSLEDVISKIYTPEYSDYETTEEVECLSKFTYVNVKDLVELNQYRRGVWIDFRDLLNFKF